MADRTLEYESPHFLHGLFADELALLRELEEKLDLTVTTRDSWIRFEGEDDRVAAGAAVFADLEEARRKGGSITAHSFRYAVNEAVETLANRDGGGETGGGKVSDLFECRLLGTGTKPPVTPRTRNQLAYVEALDRHDVVFGIGPAGTGKTYLAMAYALDLLKSRQIDRIVLTRPAVEAGEALGFLPGALEEKVLPYLRPLYDAMNDMLDGAEAIRFAEKNLIEIAPLAYMRGRTLNQSFIILDEAQNTTAEQMLMFLTRLGFGSKAVITGDPSQIDLPRTKRSGLIEAGQALQGVEGIAIVQFDKRDVVRHPLVQRIVHAYERHRGTQPPA
jgi:phosphate starvation-inducible PhoH-like protein